MVEFPDRGCADRSAGYGAASSLLFARTAARLSSPDLPRASAITHSPPSGRLVIHARLHGSFPGPDAAIRWHHQHTTHPCPPLRREHPAMSTTNRTIIVAFAPGVDATWFTASEVIDHHL